MLYDYLQRLKDEGNFTYESIAKISKISEATVKNIFTEKTPNPRFDTIYKIVTAMGGSMDDIMTRKNAEIIEGNSVITLKEVYNERLNDCRTASAEHIETLKETIVSLRTSVDLLRKDKKTLTVITCILGGFIMCLLLFDFIVGSNAGWIRF